MVVRIPAFSLLYTRTHSSKTVYSHDVRYDFLNTSIHEYNNTILKIPVHMKVPRSSGYSLFHCLGFSSYQHIASHNYEKQCMYSQFKLVLDRGISITVPLCNRVTLNVNLYMASNLACIVIR